MKARTDAVLTSPEPGAGGTCCQGDGVFVQQELVEQPVAVESAPDDTDPEASCEV